MFITFLPADQYGNLPYGCVVLEVTQETKQVGNVNNESLNVLAPSSFAWKSIDPTRYPWIEVDGPARLLTDDEWYTLIEQAVQAKKCDSSYLAVAHRRLE